MYENPIGIIIKDTAANGLTMSISVQPVCQIISDLPRFDNDVNGHHLPVASY